MSMSPDKSRSRRASSLSAFANLIVFCLTSCITVEVIQPESLTNENSCDIVVSTKDGRMIKMFGGDYRVLQAEGLSVLQGTGRLFLNRPRTEFKRFDGRIPFNEIATIERIEKSIFYYTGPIILAGVLLFVALVLIAFQGRGVGG